MRAIRTTRVPRVKQIEPAKPQKKKNSHMNTQLMVLYSQALARVANDDIGPLDFSTLQPDQVPYFCDRLLRLGATYLGMAAVELCELTVEQQRQLQEWMRQWGVQVTWQPCADNPDEIEVQEIADDPVRIYLHEIGRVHLLTAKDEKTLAKMMEEGKRINEIRQQYLQKYGRAPSATDIILALLKETGQASPIIHLLQKQLDLTPTTGFKESISDAKLRDSLSNTIDPQLISDIAYYTGRSLTETEQVLVKLEVNSKLIPKEVLNVIRDDVSLTDIEKLVTNNGFISSIQGGTKQFEAYLKNI